MSIRMEDWEPIRIKNAKPMESVLGQCEAALPMGQQEYLVKEWQRRVSALSYYSGIIQEEPIWYPDLEDDLNYLKKSFSRDIERLYETWENIKSLVEKVLHENQ